MTITLQHAHNMGTPSPIVVMNAYIYFFHFFIKKTHFNVFSLSLETSRSSAFQLEEHSQRGLVKDGTWEEAEVAAL